MHYFFSRLKKDTGFGTMLFCFIFAVWVGIVLIFANVSFIHFETLIPVSQYLSKTIFGIVGLGSGLLGLLGIFKDSKGLKIACLCVLVAFFLFIGLLLAYPTLATGSNFIFIALACVYSVYKRVVRYE